MLITLLFVAQVGCEWVQISQQDYRKPYRPFYSPVLDEEADFEYEDTTTKISNMYINQTIKDFKWKDSDFAHNNKGFVTKVEADEYTRGDKKTNFNRLNNAMKKFNVESHEEDDDIIDAYAIKVDNHNKLLKGPVKNEATVISKRNPNSDTKGGVTDFNLKRYGPDETETHKDVFEKSYHAIPNVGSIKKVHLDSRTVRTPILKEISRNQYGTSSPHNVKPPISEKGTSPKRPIITWKSDNQNKKVIPGIIQKVSKEDLEINPVENISRYEEIPLNDEDHSKVKNIFMTHVMKSNDGISKEKFIPLPDINFEKPVLVTMEEFEDEGVVTVSVDDNPGTDENTTESFVKPTTGTPKTKSKIKNTTEEIPTKDKVNTMENVLKFMKIVTDTISRNTRRSVGSKVRYLENLQDTIMANIEHRINSVWPDDEDQSPEFTRKTRSADTHRGGGHVEFPSSESALMTISFLTFAVYLIKLVLQVIHTYKNKAMLMMPAVVTTVGRTVTAIYRRGDTT